MFDELRSWLDEQVPEQAREVGAWPGADDALPCQPEALRGLLLQQEQAQRGLAQQRGSYELIQAEGTTLLASLPPGGEERAALQARLSALKRDWEAMNQCSDKRKAHLAEALARADLFHQHRAELEPWVEDCERREAEIQPSLEPAALEDGLQKARQLALDLERRRPLLEALNVAADQLVEICRVGEEEVRDTKAALTRRADGLEERLQGRTTQLDELASRLREFEEGRQAVERRLEAARHQVEVQEALGPQACSNKSLERLRAQQEALCSLQPQVAYLRDLASGLVLDAPGGSREGRLRLEGQAQELEKEFGDMGEKVRGWGLVGAGWVTSPQGRSPVCLHLQYQSEGSCFYSVSAVHLIIYANRILQWSRETYSIFSNFRLCKIAPPDFWHYYHHLPDVATRKASPTVLKGFPEVLSTCWLLCSYFSIKLIPDQLYRMQVEG